MSRNNEVTVEFIGDVRSKWRAADILPREGCVINKKAYIKLGVSPENQVILTIYDKHNMARGEEGSRLKQHFFFDIQDASIVVFTGNTLVTPHRINIQVLEEVTFTAHETLPWVAPGHSRDTVPITIDNTGEEGT